jgi:hypothetical protein
MTNKSSIAFSDKRRRFSIFSSFRKHALLWGCSGAIAVQLLLEIQTSVRSMNRWGISLKLVFIAFLIIWLIFDQSAPAQAQFFKNAETWLSTNLTPTGGGTANASLIKLVFNVLRALYLLYLGISLVRVVYSVRQDEDWQAIARTPLLILLTVSVADILTTTIVGA